MKELKLIFLLLIPICDFGQSAGMAEKSMSNYSQNAPAAAAMENTFTSQSVDQPQVGAFQKRGMQKLKDFYSYLSIISNPNYDKTLRENAKNQAKQLFYGMDCKVNGSPVSNFIDTCFYVYKGVEWKAVDVSIIQNMTTNANKSDTTAYYGELTFKESKNGVQSGPKKAEIVLSKSEKLFGDNRREVWSIYICSIE